MVGGAPAGRAEPGRSTAAEPARLDGTAPGGVPRAVTAARATAIPTCTLHVEAGAANVGDGTAGKPHRTIAAAVAAARPGAVICVAEGTYRESVLPGTKPFTLAGGFQRGQGFKVRDSARFPSKAVGNGKGSFVRIVDPGPSGADKLTAIDGFEISGFQQAIVRDFYETQRVEITNNFIHSNRCGDDKLIGAGFFVTNASGIVRGNVLRGNSCGRGGGGAYVDDIGRNAMVFAENLVEDNEGIEPNAHGGGFYLFGQAITVTANAFNGNRVTQWGGGLYVGAYPEGKQFTNATVSWNSYRGNKAGNSGGGFFCDDGAKCSMEHEIYVGNCGGNILVDGGNSRASPTITRFDHVTVVGALDVACKEPGLGVLATTGTDAKDTHVFTNSIFWNNKPGGDFGAFCDQNCGNISVTVTHSLVNTEHEKQNMAVSFGTGITRPVDPLFASPDGSDLHLRSAAGRWTPGGYERAPESSPALAKADPRSKADCSPERARPRNELGAYGGSAEASLVR